jgi:hypothetical protein
MKERITGDEMDIPHFDFILGDFNMLIELERNEIQPILYDDQNFQNKKQILFDNDQLNKAMKEVPELKNYHESEISRTGFIKVNQRIYANFQVQRRYTRL